MNSKRYDANALQSSGAHSTMADLQLWQLDAEAETILKQKVTSDANQRYIFYTGLVEEKQQGAGFYDLLSYITLCTLPCAISYDNKLAYIVKDKQNQEREIYAKTYENTTTVVSAFPVFGFLRAGRKDALTKETVADTADFELEQMQNAVIVSEKNAATLERNERAQWLRANKNNLKNLQALRDGFQSKTVREEATAFIESAFDRAIKNYAIRQGAPKALLDLPFCDYSGCTDYKLYDVFRMATLAHSEVKANGLDVSVRRQGDTLILTINNAGDGARFYLGRGKDKLTVQKVTEVKGILERDIDRKAASFVTGQLISSMSAEPAAEKLDYDFIDKMKK